MNFVTKRKVKELEDRIDELCVRVRQLELNTKVFVPLPSTSFFTGLPSDNVYESVPVVDVLEKLAKHLGLCFRYVPGKRATIDISELDTVTVHRKEDPNGRPTP